MTIGTQADIIEALCVAQGISAAHLLAHDLGDTVAQTAGATSARDRQGALEKLHLFEWWSVP